MQRCHNPPIKYRDINNRVRLGIVGPTFPVKINTDDQALLKVFRADTGHGRIARWQLRLGEYRMETHYDHVPGKELAIADGLSRVCGPSLYTPRNISKFPKHGDRYCIANQNVVTAKDEMNDDTYQDEDYVYSDYHLPEQLTASITEKEEIEYFLVFLAYNFSVSC